MSSYNNSLCIFYYKARSFFSFLVLYSMLTYSLTPERKRSPRIHTTSDPDTLVECDVVGKLFRNG